MPNPHPLLSYSSGTDLSPAKGHQNRQRMSRQHPEKVSVTFHDFCACFSEEEWKLLHEWQKELYKNIIKDIYQALTSLGPLIAASVFALRPKEKKDVCPMDNPDSERKQSIIHSPSDTFANPDVLFGRSREEKLYLKNHPNTEGIELNDCLSTGFPFRNPDMCLRKEGEANARLMDHFHAEGGETSTGPSSGFPFLNTNVCWRNEDETIVALMGHPGAGGGESITDSSSGHTVTPEVVLVQIKEEEDTYSMDHQDSVSIESITIETDDERVKPEREVGYTIASTEKAKVNEKVPQISEEKGISVRRQVWPESHQEIEDENTTQWESGFRNPTHSNLGPATRKSEESNTNNDCEKRLIIRRHPINHQRIHTVLTQKENPYQYGDREKIFSQKHYLTGKHMEKRSYQCTKCDKKFVQKGNFNMHQRTHTGEKPYQCSDCDKSFRQKGTLVRHKRTHTGERPYQCTDCEKTFSQKHHLVGHQRTHMEQCQTF